MLILSTLMQIAALVLAVVGGFLVAGWGGAVVAVAVDLAYVGVAIDRGSA